MTVILPKTPANHYGKICGEVCITVSNVLIYTCMYSLRVVCVAGKDRCKKERKKIRCTATRQVWWDLTDDRFSLVNQ